MKYFSMLALGSLALVTANPAHAGVTIDPDGVAVPFSPVNLTNGQSYTIFFDGFGGAPAVVPGLTSNLVLTLTGSSFNVGDNLTTFAFNYTMNNTSSGPITGSRVSAFGFNAAPNIVASGTSSTGVYNNLDVDVNSMPNFGQIEVCFSGQSCPGGGGGGVAMGSAINGNTVALTGGGTLALAFSGNLSTVSLTDFVVRYQSIAGAGSVDSAIGRPTTPPGAVPEPAAWAMMLIGFGMVGAFMRSSKGANVRTRIAFN